MVHVHETFNFSTWWCPVLKYCAKKEVLLRRVAFFAGKWRIFSVQVLPIAYSFTRLD
jgi:hypothetical protein